MYRHTRHTWASYTLGTTTPFKMSEVKRVTWLNRRGVLLHQMIQTSKQNKQQKLKCREIKRYSGKTELDHVIRYVLLIKYWGYKSRGVGVRFVTVLNNKLLYVYSQTVEVIIFG